MSRVQPKRRSALSKDAGRAARKKPPKQVVSADDDWLAEQLGQLDEDDGVAKPTMALNTGTKKQPKVGAEQSRPAVSVKLNYAPDCAA
jgi:hypothetical protein